MGRNSPTTPGSSRLGEERTSTGAGMSIGVLERMVARMRRQPQDRMSAIAPNPNSHTPRIASGTQSAVAPVLGGADGKALGNGCVICTIVNEIAGAAIFFAVGPVHRQ